MFGRKGKKLLAFLLSVVMTLANVDAYTLWALAAENVAQPENAGIAETEVGNTSTNEVLPDGSTDAADNAGNAILYGESEASGEYLIDDTVGYKVTDVTIDAGSYSATATVTFEETEKESEYDRDYDYIYILYTENSNADFFKNMKSVSSDEFRELYRISECYCYRNRYDGSPAECIDFFQPSGFYFTGTILKPSTLYTYRLVAVHWTVGWDDIKDNSVDCHFLTEPKTFTTAPEKSVAFTIGDIVVEDYGYDEESIKVAFDNPNEEEWDAFEVVSKGTILKRDTGYKMENTYKFSSIPTNLGELEVCVSVRTGDGEVTYVRKDVPFKRRDASERKINITDNASGMAITASAIVSPWYDLDRWNYKLWLYYKKADDSEGYHVQSSSETFDQLAATEGIGGIAAVSSYSLEERTNYQYYIQVVDAAGNILAYKGSKEEPLIFQTGEVITYQEESFKDKALYEFLRDSYGTPLTNDKLDRVTVLRYYSNKSGYKYCYLSTLEDIPEVFPNLASLYLPGSGIEDISPLKSLKSLKVVKLNDNDISEMPDLSDCEWVYLSIQGNYLKSEDIDSAKLPRTLIDMDVTGGIWRSKPVIKTTDTFYIDDDGKYPLIFIYEGNKYGYSHTVTVTIDGNSKEYSEAGEHWSNEVKSYSNGLCVIPDLNEKFTLEKDHEYKVDISIKEPSGRTYVANQVICFTDVVNFTESNIYISSSESSVEIGELHFPGDGKVDRPENLKCYVVRNEEKVGEFVYGDSSYFWSGSGGWSACMYKELKDALSEAKFPEKNYLSYHGIVHFSPELIFSKSLAEGDYDVVVERMDGVKFIFSNILHVYSDGSVNSVSIIGSGTALKPGDTLQLQAVINPTNATNQNVTWSSSDESVATVNASGLVTAVSYGSATITVTTADGGKTATYTVNVINADDSLYVEFANGKEYEYTGGKITPVVNVHYHGKLLVEGIDYTVKYTNNVNASKDKAQVTVTGKTIAASATAGFSILPKQLDAEDVKAGAILVTAGSKAVPVLYYGSYKLTAKDFTNKDAAKKFTDSGSITLEGKGNFTGQRTIPVQVVGKNEIGKLAVVLKAGQRTYNGEEQPLSAGELMVTDARDKSKVLTALAEDRSNVDDADYMIVYPADIRSAGTVKVTIVGINHYTGSVAKSYKIAPAKKAETDFAVELPTTVTYRQDGATPAVAVSIGDEKLVVNKDYKLSYSANKKIGTAKCTVTFLGNYKGSKKIVRTYEIKPASIAEAVVAVPDKAFTKAGKYISAPFVSIDGVTLNKKDYSVKYMIGDRELTAKDKLTESDLKDGVLSVDVIVKGNGNYDAETTATGTYLIQKTSDPHDLSKAKVIIRNKNTGKKISAFAYTGSEIKIGDPYEIYVTIGKEKRELKEGTDFRVTYVNNVNKGKATIILNGLGEDSTQDTKYYGSKTATFTIGKGILNWL